MCLQKVFLCGVTITVLITMITVRVHGQNADNGGDGDDDDITDQDEEELDLDVINQRPYCFRISWLGPKYNEESHWRNATCKDLLRGAKGVPCVHPLVVSNNSNIPDTDLIWQTYKNKPSTIACRLVRGEVCAKFTYEYNQAIENITYMCTKVSIEGERSPNSGCFRQDHTTGRSVEVCVCESHAGQTPCNYAATQFHQIYLGALIAISFILSLIS